MFDTHYEGEGGVGLADMPRVFPQYGKSIWNVARPAEQLTRSRCDGKCGGNCRCDDCRKLDDDCSCNSGGSAQERGPDYSTGTPLRWQWGGSAYAPEGGNRETTAELASRDCPCMPEYRDAAQCLDDLYRAAPQLSGAEWKKGAANCNALVAVYSLCAIIRAWMGDDTSACPELEPAPAIHPDTVCGPDITSWLIELMLDEILMATPFGASEILSPGGKADVKAISGRFMALPGCPVRCSGTYTLCGVCVKDNVPGNIAFGWNEWFFPTLGSKLDFSHRGYYGGLAGYGTGVSTWLIQSGRDGPSDREAIRIGHKIRNNKSDIGWRTLMLEWNGYVGKNRAEMIVEDLLCTMVRESGDLWRKPCPPCGSSL